MRVSALRAVNTNSIGRVASFGERKKGLLEHAGGWGNAAAAADVGITTWKRDKRRREPPRERGRQMSPEKETNSELLPSTRRGGNRK